MGVRHSHGPPDGSHATGVIDVVADINHAVEIDRVLNGPSGQFGFLVVDALTDRNTKLRGTLAYDRIALLRENQQGNAGVPQSRKAKAIPAMTQDALAPVLADQHPVVRHDTVEIKYNCRRMCR